MAKKGKIKKVVFHEGIEYDINSVEFKNLLLIEGKKKENENTLLGLMAQALKEDFKKDKTN